MSPVFRGLVMSPRLATVSVLPVLLMIAPAPAFGQPAAMGQWSASPFDLGNVGIHMHVLPSGKVMFWGRRELPTDSLDVHECTPRLWDLGAPQGMQITKLPQPLLGDGTTKVNLF